jgi:hypothetical protein
VSLGIPVWRFVRSLLTGYEQADGWLIAGGADELREKTRQLFTEGPRPVAEAVAMTAQLGVREDVAERWLTAVPQLRVFDGHVMLWPRSVNEKAEAVLSVAGAPLTPEEIQERIGEDYSLVGIRNQLTADARFRRVDRNKYGLARWGGEEYLGIREMIAREIERAGGEASVNTIVTNLTSRYDVSESSVRAYSGGPGFERSQRGWIRVAAPDQPGYQPRKDVSETRRSFKSRDGRWWHRVDVNAEHLRGSGSPLPTGFAAHLGMAPGGSLTASAPSGGDLLAQPADHGLDQERAGGVQRLRGRPRVPHGVRRGRAADALPARGPARAAAPQQGAAPDRVHGSRRLRGRGPAPDRGQGGAARDRHARGGADPPAGAR